MQHEKLNAVSAAGADIQKVVGMIEGCHAEGRYYVECHDADGNLKWSDVIDNIVVNVGKNLALDTLFAGSAYTVTGPYMGLAGGTPASATATDTMASKTGWTEVGGTNAPAYSGTRKTAVFSAAATGSKALSSNLSFTFTSGGTVAGCGIVTGSGAVNTLDSTAGVLYSIGAFTGGSKTVASSDSLSVSYTASL